jgi:hypothetical protein
MPVRPAVPSLPVPLDLVPAALARRGVRVSMKRLQEAATAGAIPSRLEGGRRLVDEADLDTVEAYFRAYPARPYRRGAGTAGRRVASGSRSEE